MKYKKDKYIEIHNYTNAKYKNTKISKNKEMQIYRMTKIQKEKDTKRKRYKNTKGQKNDTKIQI